MPLDGGRSAIRSATPYLIVRNAPAAIRFYEAAFGARETIRIVGEDGRVGHAELRIGEGIVFVADEHPETENIVGPETLGGTSVIVDLEVGDVVGVYERAMEAGARTIREPERPDTGVQSAKVVDPFGHAWLITRVAE